MMKTTKLFVLMTCFSLLFSYQINAMEKEKGIERQNECNMLFSDSKTNSFLREFFTTYKLNNLYKQSDSDLDKALAVLHWSNQQWKHNGSNPAPSNNAFDILEKAKKGKCFRCTEYAIVFSTAANACGLKARTLDLKTKDCESRESGAGHSTAEVYLEDFGKWVFMDPQNDVVAFKDSIPLNAYEFRMAIEENPALIDIFYKGSWVADDFAKQVIDWIYPYLYFMEVPFDNRYGVEQKASCEGNEKLMYVPQGSEAPKVFQKRYAIGDFMVTRYLDEFYAQP